MRALALHVPADRATSQCRVTRTFKTGTERGIRSCWLLASALPTTTPHQHVVDAGVECTTEEWLIPAQTQPHRLQSQLCRVGTAKQETATIPSTSHSHNQQCSNSSTSNSTNIAAAVDSTVAQEQQDEQQQSGLHILRQYVPSPAELLHNQLQQQRTANQQSASLGSVSEAEPVIPDPAKEYQKNIVRSLRTCSSVHQLSDILQQHGSSMDFMSITSCFMAAARIAAQQDLPQYPLQQQSPAVTHQALNYHQRQHNQQKDSHRLKRSAELSEPQHQESALRLDLDGIPPNQQLQQQLQSGTSSSGIESKDQLHDLLQQQLVPLLQAKLRRCGDATGLVLVLYYLAVMAYRTDDRLLLDLEHAVTPLVPQLTARLLSQLLWSLSGLGMQPQQQLMFGLVLYSSRQMPEANAQDCAQLMQGFTRLHYQPPFQWMDRFYGQVLQLLQIGHMSPQSLSMIMYSLGKLQLCPPAPLLLLLQAASEKALPELPPPGLVMLGQALHKLHIKQPSSSWQYSYLQAVQDVLPVCTARELAVLAVPLLRWRCVPPERWVQQYLMACDQCLSHMTPQGLAVLGHSFSGLRVLPSEQWLLKYLSSALQQQLASTPAGCSYTMCSLGAWTSLAAANRSGEGTQQSHGGRVPTTAAEAAPAGTTSSSRVHMETLAADCVHCFTEKGDSFTAEQFGMFCKGLALLRFQATKQLSSRLQQVVELLLKPKSKRSRSPQQQPQQQLTAATLVSILLVLAVSCPAAATPKVLRLLWPALQQQMHTITPGQAAAITWALAKFGQAERTAGVSNKGSTSFQPPVSIVEGLLHQTAVEVETASLRDLTLLLLRVRQAGWAVEPGKVQFLVRGLLKKQAMLLQQQQPRDDSAMQPSAMDPAGIGFLQQQQHPALQQWHSTTSTAGVTVGSAGIKDTYIQRCSSPTQPMEAGTSSCVSTANCRSGSSSSSSSAQYRVFGLANRQLKRFLAASSAAAGWAHLLGPKTHYAALQLIQTALEQHGVISPAQPQCVDCSSVSITGDSAAVGSADVEVSSQCLASLAATVAVLACPAEGGSMGLNTPASSRQQQQQQQLPQELALLLWKQRAVFWSQLSLCQQHVLLDCWEQDGFVGRGVH